MSKEKKVLRGTGGVCREKADDELRAGAITAFNTPDVEEVVLKARGRAISRAVDVAESESMTIREENRTRPFSTMEITLTRAKPSKGKAENE